MGKRVVDARGLVAYRDGACGPRERAASRWRQSSAQEQRPAVRACHPPSRLVMIVIWRAIGFHRGPIGFHQGPIGFHQGVIGFHQGPIGFHQGPIGFHQGPIGFHQGPIEVQSRCLLPTPPPSNLGASASDASAVPDVRLWRVVTDAPSPVVSAAPHLDSRNASVPKTTAARTHTKSAQAAALGELSGPKVCGTSGALGVGLIWAPRERAAQHWPPTRPCF